VIGSVILLFGLLLSQVKSDRQQEITQLPEQHPGDRDGGGFSGF
jgi:hypothetical protein